MAADVGDRTALAAFAAGAATMSLVGGVALYPHVVSMAVVFWVLSATLGALSLVAALWFAA